MKYRLSHRWIESATNEPATNVTKEFPLPEGEGQGEGKPRTVTQRRAINCRIGIESFPLRICSILLVLVAFLIPTARAGDILGTVTLKGTPPPEKPIDFANFAVCGKLHSAPVMTQFYLVGENKGLKDVVVMLTDVKAKSTGASALPLVLDQKGCMYVPYISAVQTGQKIVVKNSDPELHNVHVTPETDGNEEKNIAQPSGSPDLDFSLPVAENFVRFKCDVHPWMFAYVTVVDHPYFAVTDKDGKFKIANVPPGTYTIQAIHRKAGKAIQKIIVTTNPVTADFTLQVP